MFTKSKENIVIQKANGKMHALHVRYNSCYISEQKSAKQHRKMGVKANMN